MPAYLKLLLTIFLGIFLGGGLVLLHVSSDGTLQNYIVKKLQEDFYKKYECNLECRLEKIDWFSLRMYFADVAMRPMDKDDVGVNDPSSWSIVADSFVLSASWWSLLTRFRCKMSGAFGHMIMYETQKGKQASSDLLAFLMKLFKRGPSSFIEYDWMSISEGVLFVDQEDGICVHMPYACNISCEKAGTRMQFYAQKGKVHYQNNIIIDEIRGGFVWDLPVQDVVKSMYLQTNIDMHFPPLMQKGACNLVGVLKKGSGSFSLKNEDGSLMVDPIQFRVDSKKCLFDASVVTSSDLGKQLGLHDFFKDVQGSVKVDCRGDLYNLLNTVQVDVSVDSFCYKSKKIIDGAKALVHYVKPGVLAGMLAAGDKQLFEFTAQIKKDCVQCSCVNNREFILPGDSYWKIPAQQCVCNVVYDKKKGWSCSYAVVWQNDKLQKQKKISGVGLIQDQKILFQGALDDISYDIIVSLFPAVMLEKAEFIQNKKKLIHFYVDDVNSSLLKGDIDFACMQYIVPDAFRASFSQKGKIQFQGFVKDGIYYSQVATEQANIRIPRIYNVVQNVTASCEIDFYNRCIMLKDVKAELHEGEIVCSGANFFFDKAGSCQFIHAPCLLHNVLVSWDKGIFMLLSGSMMVQKLLNGPMRVGAQIIVEKSQLKDNIFSSAFQEILFGKALEYDDKESSEDSCILDIAVFTKELLHVKTSFLAAHAKLDLLLKGTIKKPELSGLIHLVSGSFYFPYKSLDITDGRLFFLPDQQFDPLLDVIAKGKLKRFGVSMHVTGSIFNPAVQFEATPYLTEEQIVSLLLLGIEENSLSVMVPALLTQKLKDLVFGPALSKVKLQSKFERLLQSLKYFRFLPQFTNQTGRGGIRGIFEVDASDHLHGKVDINFMQLEDTKFEADYAMTDDVTLRAQKDGPSTYGGEVEFRWKFGQ